VCGVYGVCAVCCVCVCCVGMCVYCVWYVVCVVCGVVCVWCVVCVHVVFLHECRGELKHTWRVLSWLRYLSSPRFGLLKCGFDAFRRR